MILSPCRLLAPLALLGASLAPLTASATPITIAETRVQACAFAGFNVTGALGPCADRPGEWQNPGISIDHGEVAGPYPDPTPGSAKVAQAIANTHAKFGVLRIDDLAGGLVTGGTNPLLYANATSRASFSDVLTFRAPTGMSTADFRAAVADLNFGFSAATSPFYGTVTLQVFARQGDSFNGNFFPGSGVMLAFADGSGEHRDLFPDRALHLSLDDGTNNRFVKFALTVVLSGDARTVASAEATAWLGNISFSRRAAGSSLLAGDAPSSADPLDGITVSAASTEMVLDPATGRFGYLAAAAIPEPESAGLMGLGLALLAWRRRAGAAA